MGEELELKVAESVVEADVDKLVDDNGKTTDEKIESSLNYESLSDAEKAAIDDFNTKMDINDSTMLLQYGAKAQAKISQFSDSVLEDVKTKNTGEVGDLLAELVADIKSFDADVSGERKGLAKIFHSAKHEVDRILAKYSKVESNIDVIEKKLEQQKIQMLLKITLNSIRKHYLQLS